MTVGHIYTGSPLALVRLSLHWLGFHETVGWVNAAKHDNIITNIFLFLSTPFCRPGVASTMRPANRCAISRDTCQVTTTGGVGAHSREQWPHLLRLLLTFMI